MQILKRVPLLIRTTLRRKNQVRTSTIQTMMKRVVTSGVLKVMTGSFTTKKIRKRTSRGFQQCQRLWTQEHCQDQDKLWCRARPPLDNKTT